jgi:AcrR family transcriptional regulator
MSRKKPHGDSSIAHADRVLLLWGDREPPTRGPKPGLSLSRIAQVAIKIADAEGLEAVSMKRVAASLGFTTMALYRYVPGKAELVHLMLDIALGPPPALEAMAGGWREKLHEWARRISVVIRKHPWSLVVLNRLRLMGPNETGWVEAAVRALGHTGLSAAEMLDAVYALIGHVRITAQYSSGQFRGGGGVSLESWGKKTCDILRRHCDAYPALHRAAEAGAFDMSHSGLDFGLERILDGIGVYIATRSGTVLSE